MKPIKLENIKAELHFGSKWANKKGVFFIPLHISKISNVSKQFGMTLIEIMLAMLLGLFLIGGVIQIFLSAKNSYRTQENLSRIQENGRFASEILSHDIRLSGYLGCSGVSATNPIVIANNPLVAPLAHAGNVNVVAGSIVTGGDNNASGSFTTHPALASNPLTPVVMNTDAITVQFGESCGGYTTAVISSSITPVTTAAIPTNNTCGTITNGTATSLGTPLVISNCESAHIFRASDTTAPTTQNKDATGVATQSLGKTYAVGSEIMLFRSYTYFIRNGASGLPTLFRLDNNVATGGSTNPVELIEGVENMQIVYGVDTDADGVANNYIAGTAANFPAASDWDKVVSLRVYLLLQSIDDNVTDKPVPYFFMSNTATTPTDRRLRKTYSITIALRN
jgi:type IV pilus assembly protein PilW